MTNGKSLAKMNQRTNFALITFLVWILSFQSTCCNSFIFGVQAFQSPKTPGKINNALSFGRKSNKSFDNETVSTFQLVVVSIANKYLKGSTNDSPAFEPLPVPNNSPAFEPLPVPNDSPAFEPLPVPNNSLAFEKLLVPNDSPAFEQLLVPNDAHAITTLSFLHLQDGHAVMANATTRFLLLLHVSNGTAITTTNPRLLLTFYQNKSEIMAATHAHLLLLSVQDGPAITVATLANFSLQLIVIFAKSPSTSVKIAEYFVRENTR
jgi:hypothetical protein